MATERQILANRLNRMLWQGLTLEGRERLRNAALQNRPWERSTGPKTEAGKNRSKMNALRHGGRSKVVRIKLDLIDRLIAGGTDTRSISKGACAAVLGSAVMLIQ